MTNVAGIEVPSTSPIFLTIVAIHVLLGLACIITGAVAMLSPKRQGRHPNFGTIYLLVPVSGRRLGERIVRSPLDSGLSLIHPWGPVLRSGPGWAYG
jgi:hypothetical protein